jgi:hypothetical protein
MVTGMGNLSSLVKMLPGAWLAGWRAGGFGLLVCMLQCLCARNQTCEADRAQTYVYGGRGIWRGGGSAWQGGRRDLAVYSGHLSASLASSCRVSSLPRPPRHRLSTPAPPPMPPDPQA